VLAYLSRYTHRVAISNSRLIRMDDRGVTFRVKDYRVTGPGRHTTMTLTTDEFIRRFPIHVLPKGQHRIRHYGFFGNGNRAFNTATSSSGSLAAVVSLTILPCADATQIAVVARETSSPIYTSMSLPFHCKTSWVAPHSTIR